VKTPAPKHHEESVPKKNVASSKEQELREAAERVYRKYGNDLAAFQRDIQRELVKRG
jgi:hypothetical protein